MRTHAVTRLIPTSPDHVLWSLIEANGKMWVITDLDPASGLTRIERAEREGGTHMDAGYYLETSHMPKLAWTPVMVAACGVFLFLVLMEGVRLTTGDVTGVVIGFWILVWMLSRREQRRRGRHYGRWYV